MNIDQIEKAINADEPVYLPEDGSPPEYGKEAEKSLRIRALEIKLGETEKALIEACAERETLRDLLDTPLFDDITKAVGREAAHQIRRWGRAHDRSKSAENWFWLVGYLAGKALRSAITGDLEKAKHHTISSAAALMQWHAAISADSTGAGVGQDDDLRAKEKS